MTNRLRRVLKLAPRPLRFRWHRLVHNVNYVRDRGVREYVDLQLIRARLWAKAALHRGRYVVLSDDELCRSRRSSKVFIFGSGYSLNDLTASEWQHFADHDVFGFSGFIHQEWIRVDYHLVRGWDETGGGIYRLGRTATDYVSTLSANRRFDDTVLVLQGDYGATFANTFLALGLLRPSTRIYRYATARRLDDLPSKSLRRGVTHGVTTLLDTVNMAYLMGWSDIVLVGVDLYDSRYFWGAADSTVAFEPDGGMVAVQSNERGTAWSQPHNTSRSGVVEILGRWAAAFRRRGVHLAVYNPRSLLARVLPVYDVRPDGLSVSAQQCR